MTIELTQIRTQRAVAVSLRAAASGLADAARAHDKATGAALLAAKASMKHGEWLPWLASTGISERRAQQIMRAARTDAKRYGAAGDVLKCPRGHF